MNISAINCTPIKPQVSFKGKDLVPVGSRPAPIIDVMPEELRYVDTIDEAPNFILIDEADTVEIGDDKSVQDKIDKFGRKLETELINADDVKKPVAALAAVAGAGVIAFATGYSLASLSSFLMKSLPEVTINGLKNASSKMQNTAARLVNSNPGKIEAVKNLAGKALGKTEQLARAGYKKLAYVGNPQGITTPQGVVRTFKNLAGWAGVATIFPGFLAKDNNEDGVKDILQKSQNVYTNTKTNCAQALNTASKVVEIAQIFV